MLELLTALCLVLAGWLLGRRPKAPAAPPAPAPEEVPPAQEQAAFDRLMCYNPQQAYGLQED